MLNNSEIKEMKLNPDRTKKEIKRLQEELSRLQKVRWKTLEGEVLGQLGDIYCHVLGNAEEGRKFYKKKLIIARKYGDRLDEMNCLGHMGRVYLEYASGPKWLQKALKCNEQALKIAEDIGDRNSECNYLGCLIGAHHALGNHEKAIEISHQGLSFVKNIGECFWEAVILLNLGAIHEALGEGEKANHFRGQALAIFKTVKINPDLQDFIVFKRIGKGK